MPKSGDTSFTFLFLLTIFFCSSATAHSLKNLEVKVSKSIAEQMVIEVTLNPLSILNSDPWKNFPPSSSFTELLGIPSAEIVTLKILQTEYSFVHQKKIEETIHQARKAEEFRKNIKLIPLGWVRDQRIAKLIINPLYIDPSSRKKIFFRNIFLQIDFRKNNHPPNEKEWDGNLDSVTSEKVLKNLIANYEEAKKYRKKQRSNHKEIIKPYSPVGTQFIKIITREEGLYRILGKELSQAGLALSQINPDTLKLYNRGYEVPLWVQAKKKGALSSDDAVTFYAINLPEEYTVYTNENVYQLIWEGTKGRRMEKKNGMIGEPEYAPYSFKVTYHGEEDHQYLNPPPPSHQQDRWFWATISATEGAPGKKYFVIPDLFEIDQEKKFTFRFSLQGLTDDPKTKEDHHSIVSINDQVIEDQIWSGQESHYFEGSFPSECLVEGDNIVKVEVKGDLDTFADQVLFNWFEIDWWTYASQKGMLQFSYCAENAPGLYEFRCRDFRGKKVEIYDITDKKNIKRIINPRIEPEITTDIIFQDHFLLENEERSYLVLSSSKVMAAHKIEKMTVGPDLYSPDNSADYLIITHEDFFSAIKRLALYREKEGFKVKVVNVHDIYDQFSFGLFTPEAIRDFLKYAYYYWEKPAPTYLLLVGDATWDYKDNLGYMVKNFLPTYPVPAHNKEDAASDNWFVCVSGDDLLPDMQVGRFPVNTKKEVNNIIDKIRQYEKKHNDNELWKKRVLFVADDGIPLFEKQSDMIAETYLPSEFAAEKLYLSSMHFPKEMPLNEKIEKTNEVFSPKVLDAINKGCGIIQFVGHGGLRVWSHKHILNSRQSIDHWEKMVNSRTFPIVLSFSCLNGYFDSPRCVSIAERFLKEKDKGAIAFVANTRDSMAHENLFLNKEIYITFFNHDFTRLGTILTFSKLRNIVNVKQYDIHMNTFLLFGDPALKINL